jgi:hypothetical protein
VVLVVEPVVVVVLPEVEVVVQVLLVEIFKLNNKVVLVELEQSIQ